MARSPASINRSQTPLFVSLMIAALLYLQYSHILYCETIRLSSFQKLDKNTYVSGQMPISDHEKIAEMIGAAERRISTFWGEKKGEAVVIVCATPGEYEKYCHSKEGAGCSLGTFYGSSFIVLNLEGLNTDVISHEMCHNELFERLGWRKTTFAIPQWFNEGLSMMLDYRFVSVADSTTRYLRYHKEWELRTSPPAQRLTLQEISSFKGFFDGDSRHVTLAYLTAATEVSYWLMIVGKKGFRDWLEMQQNAQSFTNYRQIEALHRRNRSGNLPRNLVRQLESQKPVE